jgi:hypothetical protein
MGIVGWGALLVASALAGVLTVVGFALAHFTKHLPEDD